MQITYNFDNKLRETLIYYLESIEIEFRTKIAYYHFYDFGALGYKNSSFFKLKMSCKIFNKPTRGHREIGGKNYSLHITRRNTTEYFHSGYLSKFCHLVNYQNSFGICYKKIKSRLLKTLKLP